MLDHNESINKVLLNTPKNNKLIHNDIYKDIVNVAACKIPMPSSKILTIIFFSILVDKSREISIKKNDIFFASCGQKGNFYRTIPWHCICSRYHLLSLKVAIEFLFSKHELSLFKLCGARLWG